MGGPCGLRSWVECEQLHFDFWVKSGANSEGAMYIYIYIYIERERERERERVSE